MNSPQDKAKELVKKYSEITYKPLLVLIGGQRDIVKKCAIIAVYTTMDALRTTTGHCTLRKLDAQEVYHDLQYWQEVVYKIEEL